MSDVHPVIEVYLTGIHLAHRLCIMVNGQFRCLGPTQRLKSKYGQGFTVLLKLRTSPDGSDGDGSSEGNADKVAKICDAMDELFPGKNQLLGSHQVSPSHTAALATNAHRAFPRFMFGSSMPCRSARMRRCPIHRYIQVVTLYILHRALVPVPAAFPHQ